MLVLCEVSMHRIEGSISDLVKTLALPYKKMNRTQQIINLTRRLLLHRRQHV